MNNGWILPCVAAILCIGFVAPGRAEAPAKHDLLPTMAWHGAVPMTKEANGVLLEAQGSEVAKLETTQEFTPPFKLTAHVITDVTETRIHYGKGVFIFNWANKPDEVRVHDLLT